MPFDAEHFTLPEAPTALAPLPKIEALRDFLASLPPAQFDMNYIAPIEVRDCGTVACIAGWFYTLNQHEKSFMSALGINAAEYRKLIMPTGYHDNGKVFTLPRAIRVLDILIAEGVVDWPRAIAEVGT